MRPPFCCLDRNICGVFSQSLHINRRSDVSSDGPINPFAWTAQSLTGQVKPSPHATTVTLHA